MKKYRINYTVLKNWSCTKFINGEDEKKATSNLKDLLIKDGWEGDVLTKKDIVVDSIEEQKPKKKRR
jgi:hypothetical protein